MFIQYAPYKLRDATWDELARAFRPIAVLTCSTIMRPLQTLGAGQASADASGLERTFNLTGGNIFQGAMPLHQLFAFRRAGIRRLSDPDSRALPVRRCRSPGGGVMGAAGPMPHVPS